MSLFARPMTPPRHSILREYPKAIMSLWSEASRIYELVSAEVEAIISFGSFANGDFTYVQYEGAIYAVSDLDFVAITKSEPSVALRRRILTYVRDYNSRFADQHLGFNLNIGISTEEAFLAKLKGNTFLHNAVRMSGVTVEGSGRVISTLTSMEPRGLSNEQLVLTTRQIAESLIIHMDIRIIKNAHLFPLYLTMLLARAITKFSYVYAFSADCFPGSIDEAISFAEPKVEPSILRALRYAQSVRSDRCPTVNQIDSQLVSDLKGIITDLVRRFDLPNRELVDLGSLKRAWSLLESLLLPTANAIPDFEEQRRSLAVRILKNKGDHYDFLKVAYGLHVPL